MSARRFLWALAVVPVWLGARTVAYALAPANPLADELQGRTGGTAPLAVTGMFVAGVLLVALGVLGIASLALRERAALAGEEAAPLRWRRLAGRAAVLFVLATGLFVGVEALIHLQAGLGFHGWHCLLGPVHRDALPFLAAFSVAAAALVETMERMVAWARRLVRALRARKPRVRPLPLPRPCDLVASSLSRAGTRPARGPPLVA